MFFGMGFVFLVFFCWFLWVFLGVVLGCFFLVIKRIGEVEAKLVLRTSGDFWPFCSLLKHLLGTMFYFSKILGFLSKSKQRFYCILLFFGAC